MPKVEQERIGGVLTWKIEDIQFIRANVPQLKDASNTLVDELWSRWSEFSRGNSWETPSTWPIKEFKEWGWETPYQRALRIIEKRTAQATK